MDFSIRGHLAKGLFDWVSYPDCPAFDWVVCSIGLQVLTSRVHVVVLDAVGVRWALVGQPYSSYPHLEVGDLITLSKLGYLLEVFGSIVVATNFFAVVVFIQSLYQFTQGVLRQEINLVTFYGILGTYE